MLDRILTVKDHDGELCLFQKSEMVSIPITEDTISIVKKMIHTLRSNGSGLGLAAPQIGINKRVIICSYTRRLDDIEVIINPEYIALGSSQENDWEGCFSIPLVFAKVLRWQTIKVAYFSLNNTRITKILQNADARTFQHEYDHLEGKLITSNAVELKTFDTEAGYQKFLASIRCKS